MGVEKRTVEKIGVLGGSFNPIHTGHLAIAQLALDSFFLSRVLFIPTKNHPHQKSSLTVSAATRTKMVELATASNPNFEVWYGELEREKISYTVDTISQLKQEFPDAKIYLIIGGDNLESFASWYKYREILQQITLLATARPNSAIKIPLELKEFDVKIFSSPNWGVSSTEIRQYIHNGLSGNYLLPELVSKFIKENNLYLGEKVSKTIISPSILSADFTKLGEDIKKIEQAGAEWIHCDVMDGVFVPNISFGPMIVDFVNKITDLPLDVHLMITEPVRYIEQFAKAGSNIITVHAEACEDLPATIAKIKECGAKVGVAVNPDFPVSLFLPYLKDIDLVLIMSVYAGFGGQSFIAKTMDKVKEVKAAIDKAGLDIKIEIDGGVNDETAKKCIEAGADVLVAGSFVFGGDYKERMDSLR